MLSRITTTRHARGRRRGGDSPNILFVPEPLITSEDFDALEPEWLALWAAAPTATPFHHPSWHRVWLRQLGDGTAPVFLSVRREEALIGVAALDMDREEARDLGDHNVRDYAGPLALPGEEAAVAAGILEWLREDLTPAVAVWGVPEDSPMAGAIAASAAAGGWSVTAEPEAVCPGVDLPGDFETFIASLSKHDRHELRRKTRNFEAAGAANFESVTQPAQVADGMEDLLRLMRISRGAKDEFLTPAMEAFFRDLAATFAALGLSRLSTLKLDGMAVAMTLAFEDASTTYLYNSGYDPENSRLAVGLVSKAYAIRDAIERGRQRFDFLRGEEDYKHHLGGTNRQLVTLKLRTGV